MRDIFRRITSQEFLDKLDKDKIFDLSASLAYYTALSVAPLLVLTLTAVAMLGDGLKADLMAQVQRLVGGQAANIISSIAANASSPDIRGWAGLLGVITLFFSAGAIFGQLRGSLNTIFESSTRDNPEESGSFVSTSLDFIKQKIFNMGMVLTFVMISLLSLVISSLISLLLSGPAAILGQFANLISSLVIFGLLFSGIYYFLPKKRIAKRVAVIAGIMTAFMFSIGKSLIGYYLGKSAVVSLYGAAGSLIVLLMWVYYSSLIIFISAEFANELNKAHKASRQL